MKLLLHLWTDEAGQDLTEYALLLVLVALVAIASMKQIAVAIDRAYNAAASDLAVST